MKNVETVSIASPNSAVRAEFVPAWGGIGSSLQVRGRELLYQHEFFWDPGTTRTRGGWPFLFPICGRLERGGVDGAYLYDGQLYRMSIHGFSTHMPWRVENAGDRQLDLVLTDTEATRKVYPFSFEVRLTYRAEDDALVCDQVYTNRGARPMPYYAGFHPYFRTPPAHDGKKDVNVRLQPVRRLKYNQRLTDIVGEDALPVMPISVMDPHASEMLLVVDEGAESVLKYPDGHSIHMTASGCPYVQLYTMLELPFFCIEPWMGHPNGLNTIGIPRWLEPGAVDRNVLRLWTM
jgi:galactose mutarotase-like enzyme